MNDFTKEELETINGYVKEINRKYESTDEMESIAIKIQSMIENYCEHDWDNMCCGCEMNNIYCVKCDKRLKDDN